MPIRYQHTQVGWLIFALGLPLMLLAAAVALRESLAGGAVVGVVAVFIVLSLFSLTTVVSDDAVRVWFDWTDQPKHRPGSDYEREARGQQLDLRVGRSLDSWWMAVERLRSRRRGAGSR